MNLLNPYQLLGVSINSTHKELKRAYYNLSLLCHPDKGGSSKDMDGVHKAYLYIKEQLIEQTMTYEKAEEEFELFCKKQESKLPPFSKIYEDANEFVRDFNLKFEKVHNATHDPFNDGYGHLMEHTEPRNDNSIKIPIKNIFSKEIVIYKEPLYLPDTYGSYYNFDIKKIDDFTNDCDETLQCTDYMKAFSLSNECQHVSRKNYKSLEELLEERNKIILDI